MEDNEPYLQAALLCEGVTTDENGRHNIFNEFSQCTMGYSEKFTVLTIWRGSKHSNNNQYAEKIEIIAPDGRVVATGENGPFSIQNSTYRQVNSILLEHIDFTHDGIYELQISLIDSCQEVVNFHTEPISIV